MDLRDIVQASPETVVGHKGVLERLNARKEITRFAADPLAPYLATLNDEGANLFHGDTGRYSQAYSWYALALRRVLQQCSVARQSEGELRYHPATARYSHRQMNLARRRADVEPFQELDFHNLIIHACILLDRTITLSRRFLKLPNNPSFTSFSDHIAFMTHNAGMLTGADLDYAQHMSTAATWFKVPLKVLRDKYLMHSAEQHMVIFGWSALQHWDLHMTTIISASRNQSKIFERVKWITFSPRRLARDIEELLMWFGAHALQRHKK